MMTINVYGHIIIICIGIPVVSGVVYNLREVRIKHLLLLNIDKIKSAVDALTKVMKIQQIIKLTNIEQIENVSLIGIINLHVLECQNMGCPCKNEAELYDVNTGMFSKRDVGYHKDMIFLDHFTKQLYEDSLNKFLNSPLLHVAFASYLFDVMKNTHASLIQLSIASKKKPSLQHQFIIYRQQYEIVNYIKSESLKAKEEYGQLTNIIEFENLLGDCQKSIEKVSNFQVEFWMQVTNQLPEDRKSVV